MTPEKPPTHSMVGLTVRGYEDMSRNMADITRWVCEASWQLRYYRGEAKNETAPECK